MQDRTDFETLEMETKIFNPNNRNQKKGKELWDIR